MHDALNPEFIIRSSLFSSYPSLSFGMSTRNGGVSPAPLGMNLSFNVGDEPKNVRANRAIFFEALGIAPDRVAFPGQTHSDVVESVSKPGRREKCDALTTNTIMLSLAVSIADCIPIFLYNHRVRSIAAVHSGWRGSRAGILSRTLKNLANEFNSNPGDLIAFIGPGAGVCCYEVGEDVAEQFPERYVERVLHQKPHLDLKLCNRDMLLEGGVLAANIEISAACTICSEGLFHSYRRDGSRSGRMLGVIGMLKSTLGG